MTHSRWWNQHGRTHDPMCPMHPECPRYDTPLLDGCHCTVIARVRESERARCVNEIYAQIEGWQERPAGGFVGHSWKAYLGGLEDAARGLAVGNEFCVAIEALRGER